MMMRPTLFLTSLLCVVSAHAQLMGYEHLPGIEELHAWSVEEPGGAEMSVAEAYVEANRLIIEENWTEAEAVMAALRESDPTNRNFAFKHAICLEAIPGRLEEAVPLVHLAVNGPFANRYDAFAIDEQLPPEEALELGLKVLQFSYHFAEAKALAQAVLERFPKRDYRHQRAMEVMDECDFAMTCVLHPIRMSIEPEVALNSTSADYAPVITPDGNTLYFTSHRGQGVRKDNPGQIFRSVKVDGRWSNPVRMELGTPGRDVSTIGIIGDEEALLTYQGYRNEGSIWKLTPDAFGGWMNEEKLGFPVDSRHWETSLTERFDGWERIFVSDRPGGRGGRDLYRTVKLPDGTWSEPLNLGGRINSTGDEESPVLSADGQTLIFASKGHPGMGGFDLFRCRRLDNGSWSDPEHLGHPLNTPGDEAVLTLDASASAGYISSTRGGGDDLNIYRVEFLEEPGEVLAVMIGEVEAWRSGDVMEVRSVDDGAMIFRVFRARKGSGKFLAALPPCREYKFSWVRNGETLMERTDRIGCESAYGVEQEVMRLAPFRLGGEPDTEEKPLEAPFGEPETATDVASSQEGGVPAVASAVELKTEEKEATAMDATAMDAPAVDDGGEPASSGDVEGTSAAPEPAAPVAMLEFEAVNERVEFGYGKYQAQQGSRELVNMALHIAERNMAGDVPVIQIEGSASFVPVKNKRAYESNEQLAKMRAQSARDALITELAKRGLQVGIDYQIVLEWGVAGPDYKGDAVASADTYRNYQYAKFSLSRTLVERR